MHIGKQQRIIFFDYLRIFSILSMIMLHVSAGGVMDYPVGSVATIIYIDEMDNVFIEWTDGKLSSFSDKQVLKGFEKTGA